MASPPPEDTGRSIDGAELLAVTSKGRVLFVFLDGVGIGEADDEKNPFARAALPTLQALMGGSMPTLDAPTARGPHGRCLPLDANLGMEGTPQSGTGQVALLTGHNAARTFGRHFGPWTPVKLRPLVEERGILRRALDAGRTVAFANAYPRDWPGPRGGLRVAGPPLAARGAGVLDRHEEALGEGHAVSSEIVNDGWRTHLGYDWLPKVTEEEAGRILAGIAADADLTLYAHYATDIAGHRGSLGGAVAALERVDRFFGGLMEALPADCTLLIASDHGNVEDVTQQHTRNPVLCVASGPGAEALTGGMSSITHVTPSVLRYLEA